MYVDNYKHLTKGVKTHLKGNDSLHFEKKIF